MSNTINFLITMTLTFWFFSVANKRNKRKLSNTRYFYKISRKSYHLINLPISSFSLIKFHRIRRSKTYEISALFTTNCVHITVSLWTDRTRKRKLSYSIARRYYTALRTAVFPQWDAFKQIFKSGRVLAVNPLVKVANNWRLDCGTLIRF